jgi:hypothetical protein
LYTFASNVSYAIVLNQKNVKGYGIPISFMGSSLQGAELNYPNIDKHAYVVFKVKHVHLYLLKSHTKVIVPHPSVRNLLVQKDLGDKRENWMTTLQ